MTQSTPLPDTPTHGRIAAMHGDAALLITGALGVWLGVHALRAGAAATTLALWDVMPGAQTAFIALGMLLLGLPGVLAARIARRYGAAPVHSLCVLALALLTVARQATVSVPAAWPILSLAVLVVWCWWLFSFALFVEQRRTGWMVGGALLVGCALQAAGQIVLNGVDLPFRDGAGALLATMLLTGAFVLAALRLGQDAPGAAHGAGRQAATAGWLAFGAYLVAHVTLLGNIGRWHTITPFVPVVGTAAMMACYIAVLLLVRAAPRRRVVTIALLAAIAGAIVYLVLTGIPALLALCVALIGASFALVRAFQPRPAAALPAGRPAGAATDVLPGWLTGVVACVALIATIAAALPLRRPLSGEVAPAQLDVMTYDMHHGFDARGVPALRRMAEAIEAQRPDVIALQRVTRGGNSAGGNDIVLWLRARFPEYRVAFGGTHGRTSGNAVLSRHPVSAVGNVAFDRSRDRRTHGFLVVTIPTVNAPLDVVSLHLSASRDDAADAERTAQLEHIVQHLRGRDAYLLAGPFNAEPQSGTMDRAELRALSPVAFDPSSPGAEARTAISYIMASPRVARLDGGVVESTASLHRPLRGRIHVLSTNFQW